MIARATVCSTDMYLETRSAYRILDSIKHLVIAAFLLDDNLTHFKPYQSDLGLLHLHNVIGGRGRGEACGGGLLPCP